MKLFFFFFAIAFASQNRYSSRKKLAAAFEKFSETQCYQSNQQLFKDSIISKKSFQRLREVFGLLNMICEEKVHSTGEAKGAMHCEKFFEGKPKKIEHCEKLQEAAREIYNTEECESFFNESVVCAKIERFKKTKSERRPHAGRGRSLKVSGTPVYSAQANYGYVGSLP